MSAEQPSTAGMAKQALLSGDQAVFNLLSSESLLVHIGGWTPVGLLEKQTGISRNTLEYRFEKNPFKTISEAMPVIAPNTDRGLFDAYMAGALPYPSSLGAWLYPQLENVWPDYRISLSQLHKMEAFEVHNRAFFPLRSPEDLVKAILETTLPTPQASEVENTVGSVSLGVLPALHTDWEAMVTTAFFHQLAALDIDACRSSFPGLALRMVFPAVFLRQRSGLTSTIYSYPESNLLDLLYCAVMGVDTPPSRRKMLAPVDSSLEVKFQGMLKRSTLQLEDCYLITNRWWPSRPRHLATTTPPSWVVARRVAFLAVLFAAAKMCSYLFKDVPRDEGRLALLERFQRNYREAWRWQAGHRGLALAEGQPWQDTPLQRQLYRASKPLHEALGH